MMFDEDGMVLASEGLVVPHPWEVRKSATYLGRHYFFNLLTKASEWGLDPSVLQTTAPPQTYPVVANPHDATPGFTPQNPASAALSVAGRFPPFTPPDSVSATSSLHNSPHSMPLNQRQSDSMLGLQSRSTVHRAPPYHHSASSPEKRTWDCISSSTDSLQAMAIDEGSTSVLGVGGAVGRSFDTASGGSPSGLFCVPQPKEPRGGGGGGGGDSATVAASILSKLPRFGSAAKRRTAAADQDGGGANFFTGLKHSASTADVPAHLTGGGAAGGGSLELQRWGVGGQMQHAWGGRHYHDSAYGSPPGALIVNTKSMRELMFNTPIAGSLTKSGSGLPSPSGSFGSFGNLQQHPQFLAAINGTAAAAAEGTAGNPLLGEKGQAAASAHTPTQQSQPQQAAGRAPLRVINGLGQGGYACVVQVESTEDGHSQFAMKVIPKHKATRRRDRARLQVELRVMTQVPPSPFLQQCHLAFESPTDLFFVLDLASGGDLFFHLIARIQATGGGFAEDESRRLLAEVVVGLAHLHAHGYVHRDVKVENVMLDARGHVKLVDFGLACALTAEEAPMSPTGSLIYMAPEMLRDSVGGRHTDWWAVGVLAHELLTGRTPWSSLTDKEVIRREINTMRVAPPLRLSPPAGTLVCALLTPDRKKRLGTRADADLRNAKFFGAVDWNAVASQQCPPALAVGTDCVAPRDREAALAAYQARQVALQQHCQQHGNSSGVVFPVEGSTREHSSGGGGGGGSGAGEITAPWRLGLPFVEEHPEVLLGGAESSSASTRDRTGSSSSVNSGMDNSRDGGAEYF